MNSGLLSRMGFSNEFDGHSLDVFYKLKPTFDNVSRNMDKIPMDFYAQYQPIVDREIALVKDKSKSIDEALKIIEEEGQVILDQAVKDQAEKKASGNSDDSETTGQNEATEEESSSDSPGVIVITE
ncbi:hypothetical protein D3C78_1677600 [compost metagenome]